MRAPPFAFVMLDLKLPRVSGQQVLEHLHADPRTHTLPVVVLTSSSQEEAMIDSYNHGANSYIRKPVDFNAFVNAVAQLGLYWAILNEVPQPRHRRLPSDPGSASGSE